MNSLAIIGAGSWGTALAIVLSPRFDHIRLWAHEADLVSRMQARRENDVFLPGLELPANVAPTADLAAALDGAAIVLGVMPSRYARAVYTRIAPFVDERMQFVAEREIAAAAATSPTARIRSTIPAAG